MGPSSSVPIVIGVTGHRDPRTADVPALRAEIRKELTKLKDLCPHARFVLLDSLAAGADTLCAEEALALGFSLVCPLPMPVAEYRRDFSAEEAKAFDALLARAESVFVAEPLEKIQPGRDFLYRQAGLYVAAHCHALLALWDGSAPKEGGCGTAEIVAFKQGGCRLAPGTISADTGAVIHILTPRRKNDAALEVSSRLLESEPGMLESVLKETDAYDRDAAAYTEKTPPAPLLPPEVLAADPALERLSDVYRAADGLSLRAQKRYLFLMKLFAAAGMLLVLFFLLYDEADEKLFLLLFGAVAVLYFIAWLFARRRDAHGKYLNYRLLAETARVQLYLTAAGTGANTAGMLTWTQKRESAWIKAAIDALTAVPGEKPAVETALIKKYWIDDQLAYQKKAQVRDGGQQRLNERAGRSIVLVSAAMYLLLLVLECCADAWLGRLCPLIRLPVRNVIRILLGSVSGAAVFFADYYGRLSLARKTADHEKMAGLYEKVSARLIEAPGESAALFTALAREELIENGNWLSYCRENPPSFDI